MLKQGNTVIWLDWNVLTLPLLKMCVPQIRMLIVVVSLLQIVHIRVIGRNRPMDPNVMNQVVFSLNHFQSVASSNTATHPVPINWAFLFFDFGSHQFIKLGANVFHLECNNVRDTNGLIYPVIFISFHLIHSHSVVGHYCGFIWSIHWSPSRTHHESSKTGSPI